jgi:hypothetical protein
MVPPCTPRQINSTIRFIQVAKVLNIMFQTVIPCNALNQERTSTVVSKHEPIIKKKRTIIFFASLLFFVGPGLCISKYGQKDDAFAELHSDLLKSFATFL